MEGQWQGYVAEGEFVNAEIDDEGDGYRGRIYLFRDHLPFIVIVSFATEDKRPVSDLKVPIEYQRIVVPETIRADELRTMVPENSFPEVGKLSLSLAEGDLLITMKAANAQGQEQTVTARVAQGYSTSDSNLLPDAEVVGWEEFKRRMTHLELDRYIFRGQPVQKRLRTSFHRTKRKDLARYVNYDIPRLHRAVSSTVSSYLNLGDNNHYAAFWNLLQHHGYPTPILDWTHSPYVAAFFAFRHKREQATGGEKVRLFMFDSRQWRNDFQQLNSVINVRPHFSLFEFLPLENPRATPQQALSALSTVDDIEGYIEVKGTERGRDYLKVFDLPYEQRHQVMDELRLMGITPSSLFPGLDGVCETMKMQHFGY